MAFSTTGLTNKPLGLKVPQIASSLILEQSWITTDWSGTCGAPLPFVIG